MTMAFLGSLLSHSVAFGAPACQALGQGVPLGVASPLEATSKDKSELCRWPSSPGIAWSERKLSFAQAAPGHSQMESWDV